MSMASGFRGTVNGAVQANYTDQPGKAVAGMLAFASDINYCDAVMIGETNGLAAGRAAIFAQNTASANNFQVPDVSASYPTVALTTEAAFIAAGGILVFEENMQTDENGVPGYAAGRIGRFLRINRIKGRIYVKAVEAIVVGTSSVNLVTVAGSDGKYLPGQFAPAALAGDATHGTSVALTRAKWVSAAPAGGVAIIEFNN